MSPILDVPGFDLPTSGIGSLPHTQLELALQQAFQVDIPFLPQLPATNNAELMIPQALEGFPGLEIADAGEAWINVEEWRKGARDLGGRVDRALAGREISYFEPTALTCRAWKPFLWDVHERHCAAAKAQITGPCTLRWVVRLNDGRPLSDEPEIESQLLRMAFVRSIAMVRALKETGARPLFFLDEPGLYALDRRNPRHLLAVQELKMLILALRKEGAQVGIHCCSNTDWSQILALGPDFLSVDVRLSLGLLLSQREAFKAFLAEGHHLSLGIIPTNLEADYELEELLESVMTTLSDQAADPAVVRQVLSDSMLTPACGTALRSVSDAERIFSDLTRSQRWLRARRA
jgi:hypothetical protein